MRRQVSSPRLQSQSGLNAGSTVAAKCRHICWQLIAHPAFPIPSRLHWLRRSFIGEERQAMSRRHLAGVGLQAILALGVAGEVSAHATVLECRHRPTRAASAARQRDAGATDCRRADNDLARRAPDVGRQRGLGALTSRAAPSANSGMEPGQWLKGASRGRLDQWPSAELMS